LLIITLALTMHLIVRYREIFREQPDASQDTLVIETVKSMVKPCLYTVLTTMVAFLSLVVSNIRPVIDFGWMMTLGISLALVVAFIIIPAGMMLIGKGNDASGDDNSAAFTSVFAVFTERHGNLVLLIAGALGILSIYGTTQLQVENRFIDYFRSDTEIYQGMEIIDSSLGGTTPLDIILQAPTFKPVLESSNDQPMVDSEYGDDAFADDAFSEDAFAEATPTEQSDYTDDAFGDDAFGDSDSAADPFGEDASTALKDTYWFTSTGLADLAKLQRFIEAQPEVGKVSSLVQIYDVASDLSGHKLNDFEIAFMRKSFSPDIYRQMVAPYLIEDLDETRIQLRHGNRRSAAPRRITGKNSRLRHQRSRHCPGKYSLHRPAGALQQHASEPLQIADFDPRRSFCGHYANVYGAVPLSQNIRYCDSAELLSSRDCARRHGSGRYSIGYDDHYHCRHNGRYWRRPCHPLPHAIPARVCQRR
jgi:uncharacterized protein